MTLDNILYARAVNSEVTPAVPCELYRTLTPLQHQSELLNGLGEDFKTGVFRLLIIDSIMNCFRVDYCGRGELSERQLKLNIYLHRLCEIAERKSASPFASEETTKTSMLTDFLA